jgi:hypothetical protein
MGVWNKGANAAGVAGKAGRRRLSRRSDTLRALTKVVQLLPIERIELKLTVKLEGTWAARGQPMIGVDRA